MLHAIDCFFITEPARQGNPVFQLLPGNDLLNALNILDDRGPANQIEPPFRMPAGDARKGFREKRLCFASADGADTQHDLVAILQARSWMAVLTQQRMIALNDFSFEDREHLSEPSLVMF